MFNYKCITQLIFRCFNLIEWSGLLGPLHYPDYVPVTVLHGFTANVLVNSCKNSADIYNNIVKVVILNKTCIFRWLWSSIIAIIAFQRVTSYVQRFITNDTPAVCNRSNSVVITDLTAIKESDRPRYSTDLGGFLIYLDHISVRQMVEVNIHQLTAKRGEIVLAHPFVVFNNNLIFPFQHHPYSRKKKH